MSKSISFIFVALLAAQAVGQNADAGKVQVGAVINASGPPTPVRLTPASGKFPVFNGTTLVSSAPSMPTVPGTVALEQEFNVKSLGAAGDAWKLVNCTTASGSPTLTQPADNDEPGCAITSGSPVVTFPVSGYAARYRAGMTVTGTGIPASTFIASLNIPAGTMTLTNNATASGTETMSIYSRPFAAGDIGKLIWCVNPATRATVLNTTITAVSADGISCTCGANASATLSGTGSVVFGTDDTAAFVAANQSMWLYKKATMRIPAGGYITKQRIIYDNTPNAKENMEVAGAGSFCTVIYMHPTWTAGSEVGGGDMIYNISKISGISIDGNGFNFSGGAADKLIVNPYVAYDVAASVYGKQPLFYMTTANCTLTDCVAENGVGAGFYAANTANFVNCRAGGNASYSFDLSAAHGSRLVNCYGAVSTSGAIRMASTLNLWISNSIFLGTATTYAAQITGTSEVWLANCQMTNSGGNAGGLSIASGGIGRLTNCKMSGSTLFALSNSGTAYDGGGNTLEGAGLSGVFSGRVYAGSGAVDFGNLTPGAEDTQTITVTGAATTGSPSVELGWSAALEDFIVVKQAWVSAANTVSIRVANTSALSTINPASLTASATVRTP